MLIWWVIFLDFSIILSFGINKTWSWYTNLIYFISWFEQIFLGNISMIKSDIGLWVLFSHHEFGSVSKLYWLNKISSKRSLFLVFGRFLYKIGIICPLFGRKHLCNYLDLMFFLGNFCDLISLIALGLTSYFE